MKRVFLIGSPVAHSLSPAMQNTAFALSGLDRRFELLETPSSQLGESVQRLRRSDCGGANVTLPHKQTIMHLLDDVSENALQVGAVNTIVKRDGRLLGENTDGEGFIRALLDARFEPRGVTALVFGAGGAARAAVFALARAGARRITLVNRTARKSTELALAVRAHFPRLEISTAMSTDLPAADLIVNATSLGMAPETDSSPLPSNFRFPSGAVAFDLVYKPRETLFLRQARAAGARTIDGLGMLVHQGRASFAMWTGQEAPEVQVLYAAISHSG